ncbi:MAG: tol-pal system protein YbgF [Acidobacteria bacterium]|nr:tol-pal system protein YbgF [Acidobacteriota bacterium]
MKRRLGLLCSVAILLAASAATPLAAGNKEHQQMMADIRMLQQQNQLLQAQLAALADVLKTVTTRLDEQAGVSRRAAADQKAQVDTLASDLRVVREKVDETNVRLTSLSQEGEALRVMQASAAAPAAPVSPADPSSATPTAPAGGQVPSVPPPAGFGASPARAFESARADYYAGQWTLAVQGFESYIKTFPKSDLTDDAQYYVGETYYSSGRFKEAVAAYDRLIATYPASNTLPDAYYKRGLALGTLGQVPQARESFEFVIKNYPDSDAGRLAKQALDRMSRVGRQ